jgi:hypothetical protein
VLLLKFEARFSRGKHLKDSFHEELETIVTGCPKNHTKILLGDFGAKVGFEDHTSAKVGFKDHTRSGSGNCGVQEESNGDGLRPTGLASASNMVMISTTSLTRS